ncbi:phosphotransferase family protein [Ornithinibacillus salinisoli]|uniref:Phosphotransferase family protein n=1 Tax=Ornithinibacillus salinisoli TaxID=1848459 RepID=A0ABW4W447_9BACI
MKPIEIHEIPKELSRDIHSITFPNQGCTSNVGIIHTTEGKFILKRAKGELYRQWLAKEATLLRLLTKTPLPIPRIYRFIEENNRDQSWILMEYIDGNSLGEVLQHSKSDEERHNLIYQFGNILRELHQTPCPEELITSKPWLDDMLEQSQYNLDHYEVDGTQGLLDELTENRPKDYKQTLIHGDYTIDNVLVHEGKIVGIIDWSGGAYGDPRYDAALAIRTQPNAFENDEDKKTFFAGYGETIVDEVEYIYFEQGLYEFFRLMKWNKLCFSAFCVMFGCSALIKNSL